MKQVKRIKLHVTFSGVETHEQVIKPGEYAVDDPALMGLADTLLDMGHATVMGSEEAPEPEVSEPEVVEEPVEEEPSEDEDAEEPSTSSRRRSKGKS